MPQRRRVRSPRDNGVEQHARRLVLGHLRGTRGLSSPPVRLGDGGRFALDPNFERVRAPTSSSPSIPTRRLFRSSRPGIAATVALGVVAALLPAAGAQAAAPAIDGSDRAPRRFWDKTHYTGEFHSHTSISDGVEYAGGCVRVRRGELRRRFLRDERARRHDGCQLRPMTGSITTRRGVRRMEPSQRRSACGTHESGDSDLVVSTRAKRVTWYDATGHINIYDAEWFVTAPGYVRGSGDDLGGAFPVGDFMYDLPTLLRAPRPGFRRHRPVQSSLSHRARATSDGLQQPHAGKRTSVCRSVEHKGGRRTTSSGDLRSTGMAPRARLQRRRAQRQLGGFEPCADGCVGR